MTEREDEKRRIEVETAVAKAKCEARAELARAGLIEARPVEIAEDGVFIVDVTDALRASLERHVRTAGG